LIAKVRLRLTFFAGHDDPEEFLEWMCNVNYVFNRRNFDEETELIAATSCFTGYAYKWWSWTKKDRYQRRLPPIVSWDQLIYVMSYEFAPKHHAWLMRPHRKRTRTRDAARFQLAQPPPVFDESTMLESLTIIIEDPKEPFNDPRMEVTFTELHVVNEPIIDTTPMEKVALVTTDVSLNKEQTVVASMAVVDPPTSLAVINVPIVTPIPAESKELTIKINSMDNFSKRTAPFMLAPIVFVFVEDRILPQPNTGSKRGRFDSMGRRVRRSYIARRQVAASQRRPRPWRPPLVTCQEQVSINSVPVDSVT
jgi:hypothetical protein